MENGTIAVVLFPIQIAQTMRRVLSVLLIQIVVFAKQRLRTENVFRIIFNSFVQVLDGLGRTMLLQALAVRKANENQKTKILNENIKTLFLAPLSPCYCNSCDQCMNRTGCGNIWELFRKPDWFLFWSIFSRLVRSWWPQPSKLFSGLPRKRNLYRCPLH